MSRISVEQFDDKIDSLYRLVILCARRASQVAKPDARPLVPVRSRKSTITALEEVLQGKVKARIGGADEEEFLE
ncbi:MAG: DNA-directed RNA polymerase subunit omega [Candidatus Hydrogenedentes bacterium]|nr:DNA-directed RNA polymerase subunit omega [Candidatus Hydrogenedentota bacterium]